MNWIFRWLGWNLFFCHSQWIGYQMFVIYQNNLSLTLSPAWQQRSHFRPKLAMMFEVHRGLHTKQLHSFSFQRRDFVSLFLKLLPGGLCWILYMLFKHTISAKNVTLNIWSYLGKLVTSYPFFLYLAPQCTTFPNGVISHQHHHKYMPCPKGHPKVGHF